MGLDSSTRFPRLKDPERRYQTATGLALDLERFLSDEPVRARPPSRSYVMAKFVRRHRAGVVAVAALLAAVVASGFWMAARSREAGEREAADQFAQYVDELGGRDRRQGPVALLLESLAALLHRDSLKVVRPVGPARSRCAHDVCERQAGVSQGRTRVSS